MADMDLIPDDYRQQNRLRRILRQLGLAALVVCLLVGLVRGGLAMLSQRDRLAIAGLEQQELSARQQQAELSSLQQHYKVLEARLADGGGIEGSSIRVLLRAIDAVHSPEVWFEGMRFEQTAPASVQIDGAALGHSRLATFMRNLAAQPGVAQVLLIDSKLSAFGDQQAVAFTLALKLVPEAGK